MMLCLFEILFEGLHAIYGVGIGRGGVHDLGIYDGFFDIGKFELEKRPIRKLGGLLERMLKPGLWVLIY